MCGRFSLTFVDMQDLAHRFQAFFPQEFFLAPHYNLAPSQQILTVVNTQTRRQFVPMQWGLVPYWSKTSPRPHALINVRSENVLEKPIFNPYFLHHRCLIPADGFFEWKKEGHNKIPFRATLKNEKLFAFAGLWGQRKHLKGALDYCCAILTTKANSLLDPVHSRMPVILSLEAERIWLDSKVEALEELLPLLKPFPAHQMNIYEVSKRVNATKHDDPTCILPVN